ncbi:MAG: Kelch repeat-containing protein [Marinicella sp.]
MIKTVCFCVLSILLLSCGNQLSATKIPQKLPTAVSNNAVAYLDVNGVSQFYTFNGLTRGKEYQDITNDAYVWQAGKWHIMKVPEAQLPVLASVAVTVNDDVYLFGGYTVAADHSEKSIPNVWKIDGHLISINPRAEWQAMPPMPTPVDDTVALVYQDRYIYLISGWHDVDNVDLVQVFDTENATWHEASTFPLPPVFGHAGGIVNNKMVICDGVKVDRQNDKKQFIAAAACVIGQIDPADFTQISWTAIPHHSGTGYYRMAASGGDNQLIHFVGGSNNPYNFNGIGYNGIPAEPSGDIRIFDLKLQQWNILSDKISPSMDHRSLLDTHHGFVIMGGMGTQQKVMNQILLYKN